MPKQDQPSHRGKTPKACSNCKRRKERCDGKFPCQRCIYRNVAFECQPPVATRNSANTVKAQPPNLHHDVDTRSADALHDSYDFMEQLEPQISNQTDSTQLHWAQGDSPSAPLQGHLSRLLRDPRGRYIFIGDSANLSFLQSIRKVVEGLIGECAFTQDPLRYQMVEAVPAGGPHWLQTVPSKHQPTITLETATYLIRRFLLATNCVLDLFDEADLLENLPAWLGRRTELTDFFNPIYYLVFALGAQTSPQHSDDLAETYFRYGRYFSALGFTEEPSMTTVQVNALITFYLLNASRRNAAFMSLGTAVKAAYALGLHSKEVSTLFTPSEFKTRERLWRAVRILDLFMSASLGRPPSTSETRDTRSLANFSASVDLCAIFETILTEIYSKRVISKAALDNISEHQKQWAAGFEKGLAEDGIEPTDTLYGGKWPNIGLLHVKEAYYWTIMLLTRQFLLEAVSFETGSVKMAGADRNGPRLMSGTTKVLVHACVDSAMRTIELLRILLNYTDIPKRLPFVVNSIFVSALVLGLAHFGDMGKVLAVDVHLKLAHQLLSMFPHDALARRNTAIVENLMRACDAMTEKRSTLDRDRYGSLVKSMFGMLDVDPEPVSAMSTSIDVPTMSRTDDGQSSQELPQSGDPAAAQQTSDAGRLRQAASGALLADQMNARQDHPPSGTQLEFTDPYGSTDSFMGDGHGSMHEEIEASLQLMSPTTLWFDSYDETFPLFSTIDAPAAAAEPEPL